MAMSLPRELPSGVTTTYHRILRANFNFNPPPAYQADGITVLVELEIGEYLSHEARLDGKNPVRSEVRCIPANEGTKSVLDAIYQFLSQPPGEGAQFGYEGAAPV